MRVGSSPVVSTKLAAAAVIFLIAVAFVGYEYVQRPKSQSSSTPSGSASSVSTTSSGDYAQLSDHSFQLINATVVTSGGSPAISVAYRSNLPQPLDALLVGVPYFAQELDGTSQIAITNHTAAPATANVTANARGDVTSTLVLGSIPSGVYSVEVYVTSSDGSKMLSPVSRVFLDSTNGSNVCGGEEGAISTFFDSHNSEVYVANDASNSVTVTNATTDQVLTTISLPTNASLLNFYLYDPGNEELYVGGGFTTPTFVVDTNTNFLVANITLPARGVNPSSYNTSFESMVYDPGHGKILAINFLPNVVSVIDDATNKLVANISGIEGPVQGAYDPKNGGVYVQAENGTIYVINDSTYQITGKIVVPASNTSDLVYDSDSGLLYFAYAQSSDTPSTEFLLTINVSSNALSQQQIPIGSAGAPFLYDSFNKDIYSCCGSNGSSLVAFSTESNSVVATIPLPGVYVGPPVLEAHSFGFSYYFLYDPINGDLYAVDFNNPSGDRVIQVSASSNSVVSTTFLHAMLPYSVALDPTQGKLFAGDLTSVYAQNLSAGNSSAVALGSCGYYFVI